MNYFNQKSKLIQNVNILKGIVQNKLNENTEDLDYFEQELNDLNFNVLCLGDFSSGKSTFINNFFLENKIKLPVRATTTTAKLTIVKYGEELKVVAYMKGGVINEIKDNIEKSLKELVATKGNQLDDVEFIEVFIPSPILKEGVVIIDSPGLNDPESERMDVTYKFVNQADCVLYFLNAQQAWKQSEKDFLEEKILSKNDLDKIFFLMNYWDTIEDSNDRQELIDYVDAEIIKSIEIAKEKLRNPSIKKPPLIPISAKTKENFNALKTDLLSYLGGKKSQDILNAKLIKYNHYIEKYIILVQDKKHLINLNKNKIESELKQQESSLNEYKLKSEKTERKIVKSIANKYDILLDNIRSEYKQIINKFDSDLRHSNIENPTDFEQACSRACKTSELSGSDNMGYILKKFKRDIQDIFDKEKSDLNISMNKIIDDDFLMAKIISTKSIGNRDKLSESLAGGVSILSLLSGGTIGTQLLMAPTVVTVAGSPGIWATAAAWFGGTTATTATVTGISGLAIVGIASVPLVFIGVGAYSALKKRSKEKFQQKLNNAIDENVNRLKESYDAKIKDIKQAEDSVSSIIARNISNEFTEIYQTKLDQYKEASGMSNSKFDVDHYDELSQEIKNLKISCQGA